MKTLQELFNSPSRFSRSKQRHGVVYEWWVEDQHYEMTFSHEGSNEYETEFRNLTSGDSFGITGSGGAARVFATVVKIMEDFIKFSDPDGISFSAKTESRKKLYSRMLKRFSDKYVYDLDGQWYVMTKKSFFK